MEIEANFVRMGRGRLKRRGGGGERERERRERGGGGRRGRGTKKGTNKKNERGGVCGKLVDNVWGYAPLPRRGSRYAHFFRSARIPPDCGVEGGQDLKGQKGQEMAYICCVYCIC
jgi:hypothetical protein